MTALARLTQLIQRRYAQSGCPNRYPTEYSLAEFIMANAPAAGLKVIEPYAIPNRMVRDHEGLFSFHFGLLHDVQAHSLAADPHINVHFVGGVRLELTPDTAAALARQLPEALAKLPTIPDIHDAVGGDE